MQLVEILNTSFSALPSYLWDANKRIFWLYLASAVLLSLPVFFALHKRFSLGAFARFLFPKKIWLHPSARQDYWLFIINRVLKAILWAPFVLTMVPIALSVSDALENTLGMINPISQSSWMVISSFTLLLFVLDDFTRFILHLALHKIPFLWDFHKVHHSAKVLTPMTIYRSHPFESFLYASRMALAQGVAVGIAYYLFGPSLKMFDLLGANLFVFIFNVMGSNLRHSHVRWGWGDRIERWFVSPAQHQVHHSDQVIHFDKNLGSALAIWDRLCGTLVLSSTAKHLHFGLGKQECEHYSLLQLYWQPIKQAGMRIVGLLNPADKQRIN